MSQLITIEVRDKIASCLTEKPIVCGNSDYEIHFDFDEEWNGHEVKTAVFTVNGKSVLKPFSGTVCKIPELNNTLILWVGVFAGTIDDGTLSTSTPALVHCIPCATDGEQIPLPPPDDVYNQIVELCDEAVSTANDVKERADNGELDGKSAYQYAVEGGYEGSEEAFTRDIANINIAKESAEQSASDASTSAQIAVESAESAEQSASNASTSEQKASEAAQNASMSEQNAGQSAESAERAALNASASAQNANLSEQNAVQSAESAGLSASNALESEQKASGHAQDAGTHREVTGRLSMQADKSAQDASASAESALASADRANAILEDVKKEADAPKRYANNVFANALKGHKTGAVISADDVSPIEHELDVKVSGKNLFKMPDKITPDSNKLEITDNSIVITNTKGSTWTGTKKMLKEFCPSLKAGDTAVLTFTSTNTSSAGKYIYLETERSTWNNGASKTITETSLNSMVVLYCSSELNSVTTISNIQIEKGTVATDYAPYVEDVGGTVVKRHGKNIFSNDVSEIKQLNRIGSDGKERKYHGYDISLPMGTYRISARRKPEAGEGGAFIYGYIEHIDGSATALGYSPVADTAYSDKTFSIIEGDKFYLYNATGAALEHTRTVFNAYNIQIEHGDKTTDYEPYSMVEAVADADGNVEGLTSLVPSMTVLGENGTVIDCTYNRDINKAFEEITQAMISMGANI